jgi:hypothetical protein
LFWAVKVVCCFFFTFRFSTNSMAFLFLASKDKLAQCPACFQVKWHLRLKNLECGDCVTIHWAHSIRSYICEDVLFFSLSLKHSALPSYFYVVFVPSLNLLRIEWLHYFMFSRF